MRKEKPKGHPDMRRKEWKEWREYRKCHRFLAITRLMLRWRIESK